MGGATDHSNSLTSLLAASEESGAEGEDAPSHLDDQFSQH